MITPQLPSPHAFVYTCRYTHSLSYCSSFFVILKKGSYVFILSQGIMWWYLIDYTLVSGRLQRLVVFLFSDTWNNFTLCLFLLIFLFFKVALFCGNVRCFARNIWNAISCTNVWRKRNQLLTYEHAALFPAQL